MAQSCCISKALIHVHCTYVLSLHCCEHYRNVLCGRGAVGLMRGGLHVGCAHLCGGARQYFEVQEESIFVPLITQNNHILRMFISSLYIEVENKK